MGNDIMDISFGTLFVASGTREYVKLGGVTNLSISCGEVPDTVTSCEIEPTESTGENIKYLNYEPKEFSFTYTLKKREARRIKYLLRQLFHGSNNWRRLHGLPMIRKGSSLYV